VEELASAIGRVLESGELQDAMRRRGLAQAKRFSWETCARETLKVYAAVGARG
jgi:glycosyltransferase involved in cell wall biosynthesis